MRRTLTLATIGLCLAIPGAALAQQESGAPAEKQQTKKRADIYDEKADAKE